MIFDEVDRGVGGAVASAIGERLARLAAAFAGAGRHPLARRSRRAPRTITGSRRATATSGTRTTVRKLDEDERREEIARMLSGASITDEARAQASRLLDAA